MIAHLSSSNLVPQSKNFGLGHWAQLCLKKLLWDEVLP